LAVEGVGNTGNNLHQQLLTLCCAALLLCRWTKGKVLFASGSPFDPITDAGVVHYPAQANNAYIFPAVGYAAILAKSSEITGDSGFWCCAAVLPVFKYAFTQAVVEFAVLSVVADCTDNS
jgi:hypothetical protein